MSTQFLALRAAVRSVITEQSERAWTVQGFGMLRTYLDVEKRYRLNIWDSSLAVPGVSIIHDHPWDFSSWIISGSFSNVRYTAWETEPAAFMAPQRFSWSSIITGEGGGKDGASGDCWLCTRSLEHYRVGDTYAQERSEVHASFPTDGCVTLNDRTNRVGEHARVFWSYGEEWVDAEPRDATADEVTRVVGRALSLWSAG